MRSVYLAMMFRQAGSQFAHELSMFVDGASKFRLRATKPSLSEMPLPYRDKMSREGSDAKKSTEPVFFFSEIVPPPELY
jgi:hypothetical protein